MVLQAYIDDSVQADQILVFAGYVASVEQWLAFSDEWKEGLALAHWPVFKMAEAASGDRDKLERAGFFYRIIENNVDRLFAVALEIDGLKRAVRELGLSKAFENPYALIYPMMYDFTRKYRHEIGITDPIDLIFDKHGSQAQVEEGFRYMLANASEEARPHFGQPPRFEDDKKFLPLQAADLLAWHIRKQWIKYGSIVSHPCEFSWLPRKQMTGLVADMRYGEIRDNLINLMQMKRKQRSSLTVSFTSLNGQKF